MRHDGAARRAFVVIGTRPEAIKLAPVIKALEVDAGWQPIVVTSGQHGDVVDEVFDAFGIVADVRHEQWEHGGDLARLHTVLVDRLAEDIAQVRPDAVVVQGDTATTLAGAMAGFFARVPVIDVEAGLRSGNLAAPFPEEGNRCMITRLSALHLAPTTGAAAALDREGVDGGRVVVTGNTVIDALMTLHPARHDGGAGTALVRGRAPSCIGPRRVLVTCHRRENWGAPVRQVADAIRVAAMAHPHVDFEVVCHPNPAVHEVFSAKLAGSTNVEVTGPLGYLAFLARLSEASVVVTDSGGVQEEAPAFGVPVLVLRDVTERPEGVAAGVARLVGTDTQRISAALTTLLEDPVAYRAMAHATNPYGDGHAAKRCVDAMNAFFDGAPVP